MPADGVGRVGRRGQGIENRFIQVVGVGTIGLGMDHQFGNGDGCGTAFGAQFVKGRRFRTDTAVVGNIRTAHGGRKDTVAEGRAANGDGAGYVREFSSHEEPPVISVIAFLYFSSTVP